MTVPGPSAGAPSVVFPHQDEFARKFLAEAVRHLGDARVIHRAGRYPGAITSSQKAAELAIKAVLVLEGSLGWWERLQQTHRPLEEIQNHPVLTHHFQSLQKSQLHVDCRREGVGTVTLVSTGTRCSRSTISCRTWNSRSSLACSRNASGFAAGATRAVVRSRRGNPVIVFNEGRTVQAGPPTVAASPSTNFRKHFAPNRGVSSIRVAFRPVCADSVPGVRVSAGRSRLQRRVLQSPPRRMGRRSPRPRRTADTEG